MSAPRDRRPRDPRRPGATSRSGSRPSKRPQREPRRPDGGVRPSPSAGSRGRAPREARGGERARRRPASPPPPPPLLRRTFRRGEPLGRIKVGGVLVLVILLLFAGRLVQIQVVDAEHYAEAASNTRLRTIDIPTLRGQITDADGNPFALSLEVRTVFVDPGVVDGDQRAQLIDELATRFDLERGEVAEKVDADPSRYEVIARDVLPEDWEELEELGLAGVGSKVSYNRVYPEETGAADLVGFVGDDGHGLEGLEGYLDDTLAGESGKRRVEVSLNGTQIPMAGGLVQEPEPGQDVRLTLDQEIQWYAAQTLADRVEELDAEGGSVIVERVGTGEVLAMADYPTYSPNDISTSGAEEWLNGAVSETFEPGSTNKVITLGAALEEGITTPETVYTVPYSIKYQDQTFRNSTNHGTQRLTVNGIMAQSSNVGTIKIADQVGAEVLHSYMEDFGLGQPTGLQLPGENEGILTDPEDWWGTQLPSVSIGHGLSVNAAQLASVYSTIANGGVRVDPRVVAGTVDPDGEFAPAKEPDRRRVVSEETAEQLALMLEAVTSDEGTAPEARIDGYRVAGKTGTANRINPETGSYEGGGYTATFAGFAPADDPQVVVQVVLHNPKETYYGGQAAGPVFNDIMSFALKSLKVPPTETDPPAIRLFENAP
ncbi:MULTISPECIES: peptidoglycan D,D-transpeptidase FtsI family protein [Nocardiopsis]|uniref:Peptidoglycan glycosyltransferase n=1 Tax=Nocardiopsis sinuspersici TaxID=501010 RepID=A0A1V3BY20_9ACTN|nr:MULTISPECIES: penicillin-binding protein 2 [Nocardiopsis]OOC53149.1 peptidoglycan glycosyltransferase [Nocardiopsis sinuspersici]